MGPLEELQLNLDEYQAAAIETAIYPEKDKIIYPALGLSGEAGEVANQAKKILRDDKGILTPERKAALFAELGDVC